MVPPWHSLDRQVQPCGKLAVTQSGPCSLLALLRIMMLLLLLLLLLGVLDWVDPPALMFDMPV